MVTTSASNEVTRTAYSQASWRSSSISTKPRASCPSALRLGDHHPGQTAAEQDHAPLPAPAHQADLAVLALPAGPGITPIIIPHRPLEHPFNPLRQAQLEQIGLAAALRLADYTLVAPVPIAAQQPRCAFAAPADPIASIVPAPNASP